MKKLILLFFLFISINAFCKGGFRLVLTRVQTNLPSDKKGEVKIDSVLNEYSDGLINVWFITTPSDINFTITNKSESTIRLLWNDAAYIDENSNTRKVFHNGVKYINRNEDQPPSSIISGAKLTDLVAPTDNVYLSNGWSQRPLFRDKKSERENYVGKHVKVLLPVIVGEKKIEYIFDFKIAYKE